MSVAVKICGFVEGETEALQAAVMGGASYLGFVFVPISKRYITPEKACSLVKSLPDPAKCRFGQASQDFQETGGLVATALFVDPTDQDLTDALTQFPLIGLIQLHGHETPPRVKQVQKLTGLPVMKVLHIATSDDFAAVTLYEKVADMLLFDTKVGTTSGGTGKSFDWSLLAGRAFAKPWMLAGGLSPQNVKRAIKQTGASIVDVSSGIETNGAKDAAKINAFLKVCL